MARTTPERIQAIIEWDEAIALDPFIEAGHFIVNKVLLDQGYTEVELELIETWLSAHFYAVRDPRATYEMVRSIAVNYEAKTDLGLNLTRYGQQAMLLDTSGKLKLLNNPKGGGMKVKAVWLGYRA